MSAPGANGSTELANVTRTGQSDAGAYALVPQNFAELEAFCRLIATSDLAPRDFKGKPGNVLVAVQMGAEIGLKPMQAIQNIAVINGRPAVYGDAALGLIKQHPLFVSCEEHIDGEGDARTATCTMVRKGEPPYTNTFSVLDAKRAKLFGKEGPWTQYPDRMLKMRARGFTGRDAFPDALKGLSFAEEAMDIPATDVTPAAPVTGATRTDTVLAKISGAGAPDSAINAEIVESKPDPAPADGAQGSADAQPAAQPPAAAAAGSADAEKLKARDLRNAIARAWKDVPRETRAAILVREYARDALTELTIGQLEDFLERTPDLIPDAATAGA